jgi:hypothetical protein
VFVADVISRQDLPSSSSSRGNEVMDNLSGLSKDSGSGHQSVLLPSMVEIGSVATAMTNVFQINEINLLGKFAKIM